MVNGQSIGPSERGPTEARRPMSIRSPLTVLSSAANGALMVLVVTGLQAAAPSANALPLPAQLPLPVESMRLAVHLPTGCMAELVTNEGTFVKAQIVDIDCLPEGSAPRDVPGTLRDFSKDRELGVPGWRP